MDDFRAQRDAFYMPDAVELAIWFHDAVYVPGARDNEERSAALLRKSLDPARALFLTAWTSLEGPARSNMQREWVSLS